jgi:hypothetical protein
VREFCAEAIRRAGGQAELATALVELGFTGHGGEEYNEKAIGAWPAGRRAPASAILVALAIRYRIPLDGIIAAAEEAEAAAENLRMARSLTLTEERSA